MVTHTHAHTCTCTHLDGWPAHSNCTLAPVALYVLTGVLAKDQDAARQKICNWLDGHKASAAAFDFPTKGILQYAVDKCEYWRLADSNNKPPGLLGWWPSKSVVSCYGCCRPPQPGCLKPSRPRQVHMATGPTVLCHANGLLSALCKKVMCTAWGEVSRPLWIQSAALSAQLGFQVCDVWCAVACQC